MQNPTRGTVKPSVGMKAAAQQKHTANAKKAAAKDSKRNPSSNSSESEDDKPPAAQLVNPVKKVERRRSSVKQTPANTAPRPGRGRRGRPPKNTDTINSTPATTSTPVKVQKPLPLISSSTTESSASDSDSSESTADSSSAEKSAKKKDSPSDGVKKENSSDKKLTRSSSVRKSRHLVGNNSKGNSETDTDSTKRSLSRSPKRFSKLNHNNKKSDTKLVPVKIEPPEKRECPLDECNSTGHLGGQFDSHFTIEACPVYHNMVLSDTKQLLVERKRRDDERKKGIEAYERSRKTVTTEQKAYAQKIRESRAKFKSPTPSNKDKLDTSFDRDREPNLKGFVPDYDYQLFRQAQALASENIENELKTLPASRGTKYITMGKNCMQVWYQSPYPEDVARLPKLYLCEFCLRYQKCAIGMKRHAAKCLWRHPPGDEIYRKGKLSVWQIDGKRQKQYCQHLCLLAKFFLDHKTLYYDVEPFLFYVMTVADADGCHTIGYFSKVSELI